KNFKQRYPSLLDPTKAKIEIGVTPKIRTEQTADAFLQGIKETVIKQKSGAEDSGIESDESSSDESEEQGVRLEKPKLVKELRISSSMQSLIKRVNKRLGFGVDNELDAKQLRHIVRACYFEFALFGQNSGWCSVLGDEEIRILEYLDDIEDYYEDAYGRDINGKQTCPLIGDLFAKVKQSVDKPKELKTHLQFTHAGVMKRLYSGLGLFDHLSNEMDSKTLAFIKSDESVCLGDNRKWKSSLICPFSANFAAILYKCKDSKSDDKKYGKYKLLTLVQEKPVIIKGCDSYLCSVDKFIESFQQMTSNCDLKEICRI
ncbi:unnamed protein product, partial [Oppiella nova]